ncbi:MAG TPA: PfkB family carbohydrate kinase [Chitinophagaceae bacterium]|nr:PfkB family carbohydrate kinase [Chitinophagaceae bacterium]
MEDFKKLFDSFSKLKVGVIGDVMLDTYMWGGVERISPEAPVPVVSLHKKDYRIGGAGNVALNAQSLGAETYALSVIGKDDDGLKLEQMFEEKSIRTNYLVKSNERITTNKTRIISRNQQMMRLDAEITNDLNEVDTVNLLDRVKTFITKDKPDVMIFEDYNKGILTQKIIHDVIALCKKAGVLTAVDPKRKNFFSYRGVDIFKPNLKEVKDGLNLLLVDINKNTLGNIHREVAAVLRHAISFITLSDKGVFYQQNGQSAIIESHLRNIADVSGAGDTVIAVASLVYAVTKNVHLMAEIANIAGGLVCEEVGTVAINKQKLLNECEILLS